jgi:superfamily II DNA or RNA helicase
MTAIRFGNTRARLDADIGLRETVRHYLTYRAEGFQYTRAYKMGRWDGFRTVYRETDSSFPAGLAWDVAGLLRRSGEAVDVVDERGAPPSPHPRLAELRLGTELMPHQEEAVLRVQQRTRGVVHHPVGAGKSVVIVEIARRLAVPTLVLVQRKELLRQQYDQFVKLLGDKRVVGVVGDGIWRPGLITVATIQTLARRQKDLTALEEVVEFLAQWQCVLVDECHHLPAASYSMLLNSLPNAYWRVGLSATPHRSGNREQELYVTGLTGPVISEYDASEGIDMGRLVPADIFLVDPGGYPTPRGWRGTYAEEVEAGIVNNTQRNELVVKAAESFGQEGPTLVLTERLAHGRNLRALLLADGWEEYR